MADFYEDYEENIMRAQRGEPVPDSGSGYGRGVTTGIGITSAVIAALYAKKHGGVRNAYKDLADLIRGSKTGSYIKDKWNTFTKNRKANAELKAAGINGSAGAAERLRAFAGTNKLTKNSLKEAEDRIREYEALRDKATTAVNGLDKLIFRWDAPDARAQAKTIADSLRQ